MVWFVKETYFDISQAMLKISLTLRQVNRQFIALTALLPDSKAAICDHMSFSHDLSKKPGNLYQLIQWPWFFGFIPYSLKYTPVLASFSIHSTTRYVYPRLDLIFEIGRADFLIGLKLFYWIIIDYIDIAKKSRFQKHELASLLRYTTWGIIWNEKMYAFLKYIDQYMHNGNFNLYRFEASF